MTRKIGNCVLVSVIVMAFLPPRMSAQSNIVKQALSLSIKSDSLYVLNDRIKDKKWGAGRAKWALKHVVPAAIVPGVMYTSPGNDTVILRIAMGYRSGKGNCIQFLTVYGDMLCTENIINFQNLRYIHTNIDAPPTTTHISGGICSATGTLDKLKECAICRVTIDNVVEFINASLKELTIRVQRASTQRASGKIELVADELKKLKELQEQGILTEEEFQKQKEKLLGPK